MSTKCTVLWDKNREEGIGYHFYFDYKDMDYHLEFKNKASKQAFFKRIGNLLEGCPMADAGLYMLDLTGKGKDETIKSKNCYWIKNKITKEQLLEGENK